MIVADREYVTSKYKLHKLKDLENLVADAGMLLTEPKPSIRDNNKLTVAVQINIPFNNPITGFVRFLTLRTSLETYPLPLANTPDSALSPTRLVSMPRLS